ncbi:protein FAR1-RELATED SEQUENCE 5-like [Apium graveolens]|uniref:protein FAR1-RELATED SEQUENCE 5-like n=1 Tax=Apium graveolens TaxID=4045 RepID=UPI003D7A9746
MSLIKRERHVTAAQNNLIKSFHVSGIAPRQQMSIFGKMHGGEEQIGFHAQHLRNVVRDFRKDNLGVNDAQAGLDLLHRYAMPFVPFTGVNHHYQSVLFGFALMRDELKTTFEWVLGTWLEAVEGKTLLAIITDQDQAMAGQFNLNYQTRHICCVCGTLVTVEWHL